MLLSGNGTDMKQNISDERLFRRIFLVVIIFAVLWFGYGTIKGLLNEDSKFYIGNKLQGEILNAWSRNP